LESFFLRHEKLPSFSHPVIEGLRHATHVIAQRAERLPTLAHLDALSPHSSHPTAHDIDHVIGQRLPPIGAGRTGV
jgi:hypothetical protein